jgi:hypothetical protein
MNTRRLAHRAAATALAAGLSLLLPQALSAQCTKRLVNDSNYGWVQEITCCGESCCTTRWKDTQLVSQVCG